MKLKAVMMMMGMMLGAAPGAVILTDSEEAVTVAEETSEPVGLITVDLSPLATYSYHHPPNDQEDWGERICEKLEPYYDELSPHYQRKFDRYCGGGSVPELKTAGLLILGLALGMRRGRSE